MGSNIILIFAFVKLKCTFFPKNVKNRQLRQKQGNRPQPFKSGKESVRKISLTGVNPSASVSTWQRKHPASAAHYVNFSRNHMAVVKHVVTAACKNFSSHGSSPLQKISPAPGRTIRNKKMEPAVGFEPTTDGLQNRSSTTELSWHFHSIQGVICHGIGIFQPPDRKHNRFFPKNPCQAVLPDFSGRSDQFFFRKLVMSSP